MATSRFSFGRTARALCAATLIASSSVTYSPPAKAQFFVIDIIAELNTYLTYFQTLTAYIEQINEWRENVEAMADYVTSPYEETVNGLLDVVDLVDSHMGEYGGIDSYLALFQDTPFYRATECFSNNIRCTQGRIAELMRTDQIGLQGVKRSNDRLFRGIEQQQRNLRTDSARLRDMSARVNGVQGRNAQVQAAAQLANEQAHQLLQIRTLLVAQQQAQATESQLKANRDARHQAVDEVLRSGEFVDRGNVMAW